MTVGFTGYRYEKLPFAREDTAAADRLRARLYELCEAEAKKAVRRREPIRFISGFAQGSDLLFAQAVEAVMAAYPSAALTAALPYPNSQAGFCPSDRAQFEEALRSCTEVEVVCPKWSKDCYFRRNDYILEESDLLIAVYDGKPGGTAYTVGQAGRRGIETVLVRPGE